jgi:SAM-dependent methyltransferase
MALARIGYRVTGVDFNRALLEETAARASALPVWLVEADLTQLDAALSMAGPEAAGPFDVVVCMGDTLPHLPSKDAVERLLAAVARRLAPEGRVVLGFRDQSHELTGAERILPVRMDDADRVMLTVLEYLPEQIAVHDVVLMRQGERWTMAKSWYPKLRLAADDVKAVLPPLALAVVGESVECGMTHLILAREREA